MAGDEKGVAMPYVRRDDSGRLAAVYATEQDRADAQLSADHSSIPTTLAIPFEPSTFPRSAWQVPARLLPMVLTLGAGRLFCGRGQPE